MNVLLDTSVVVAHLRRRLNLFTGNRDIKVLSLPLTVLGELYKGAERSDRPHHNYGLIEKMVEERFELLCPNDTTARCCAQIAAKLERLGQPIPENDLWIAAAALESDLPLATRDAHFERVPGLTVPRW